jgi:type VI secretion system protein ImpJ
MSSPLPDAIQWSEGMMLSPQHFQQNDRYWQAHMRHRLQSVTPHYWGVKQLRFDIVNETLHLRELECILPDGLLVAFPGQFAIKNPDNLVCPVGNACKTVGASVKVWCWVNARGDHAACQDSMERRYNSVMDIQIGDENTGDSGLPLARLQVEFHLYIGNNSPSPDCAVPLLEIVRGDNQQLQVSAYHPPLLHIGSADAFGNDNLWQRLHQLHDRLWDKLNQLGEQGKNVDQEDNLGSEKRQHLTAARLIGSALPQLSILLLEQTHPSHLYMALAQVVGQISNIGSNPLPLLMHPYQHDNCMPQFQQAFDFIQSRLDSVDTRHNILSFLRTDLHDSSQTDACFERRLPAGLKNDLLIELEPRDTQTGAQLLSWLTDAVIAEAALIPQLRRARVSGASVRALQAHEIEREKLRPQGFYFLLENQRLLLDDQGPQETFRDNQLLQIQGRKTANLPAAISLYHRKAKTVTLAQPAAEVRHD